ncbi:alpha/beta hydrolase [Actinoplanes subtropicus]|uniref:alpha/beta hydrolase n=1 Tax=Actinoplanes subtropicus TaxID=543632 RepID=UPI0004C39DE2|nr:alpha/beta hydrolase [Actinoplanes subtropicus]
MDFLQPFVLPVATRTAERHGPIDLYPPDDTDRARPAVLIVHGGPMPAQVRPTPRDWPVYQAYASLVAARGVVGATVDHRLHTPAAYPDAAGDVRAAVDAVRADPRVDGERIALWFFSGGGLLAADWLREPPSWLRCVALTYPVLVPLHGWPVLDRFRPVDAVALAGDLPIVLTRVGRENPAVAEGVSAFLDAAKTRPDVVEVPHGRHGFDYLDDDDASRAAILRAIDLVLATMI